MLSFHASIGDENEKHWRMVKPSMLTINTLPLLIITSHGHARQHTHQHTVGLHHRVCIVAHGAINESRTEQARRATTPYTMTTRILHNGIVTRNTVQTRHFAHPTQAFTNLIRLNQRASVTRSTTRNPADLVIVQGLTPLPDRNYLVMLVAFWTRMHFYCVRTWMVAPRLLGRYNP